MEAKVLEPAALSVVVPPYSIAGRPYYCPVQLTVEALSGRWKPMILWHLLLNGKMRYGELRKSLRSVTHKMLTQSLRELESDGFLLRVVHQVVPPKVEYSLSPRGEDLRGIFMSMRDFGEGYRESS